MNPMRTLIVCLVASAVAWSPSGQKVDHFGRKLAMRSVQRDSRATMTFGRFVGTALVAAKPAAQPVSALPWYRKTTDVVLSAISAWVARNRILTLASLAVAAVLLIRAMKSALERMQIEREERERRQRDEDAASALVDFGKAAAGFLGSAALATASAAADALSSSTSPADDAMPDASVSETSDEEPGAVLGTPDETPMEDPRPIDSAIKKTSGKSGVTAEDAQPFIPAARFEGRKPGYVFKNGYEGKGYYNREYEWL